MNRPDKWYEEGALQFLKEVDAKHGIAPPPEGNEWFDDESVVLSGEGIKQEGDRLPFVTDRAEA